eukprot:SAG11_NODE_2475_length_3316_cov_2.668635_2_plen_218_part_00
MNSKCAKRPSELEHCAQGWAAACLPRRGPRCLRHSRSLVAELRATPNRPGCRVARRAGRRSCQAGGTAARLRPPAPKPKPNGQTLNRFGRFELWVLRCGQRALAARIRHETLQGDFPTVVSMRSSSAAQPASATLRGMEVSIPPRKGAQRKQRNTPPLAAEKLGRRAAQSLRSRPTVSRGAVKTQARAPTWHAPAGRRGVAAVARSLPSGAIWPPRA